MKKVLSIIIVIVMLGMTLASCTITGSSKPTDLIQLPEAEYKEQCQTYDYKDIMRYPDDYNKKLAVFKGEVVQIMRKGNEFQMRVSVTYNGSYYTDTMYVFYTQKSNENFLEDDIIIMYGELRGTQKYESILGQQIEIPRIYVQYIDLVSPTTTKPTTTTTTPTTTTTTNQNSPEDPPVDDECSEGLEFAIDADGESYSLTGIGTCTDTDIVIPDTYEGLPVTIIAHDAFEDCESVLSIVIPDSVTKIDYCAFQNCSSLVSISIPNSVTSIDQRVFWGCSSLTSISIPESVTSIGFDGVFRNCNSLTEIIVAEKNQYYKSIDGNLYSKDGTKIIQYALGKNEEIFVIPDTVITIGSDVFYGCSSLEKIIIPNSVNNIYGDAFASCTSLTSIVIPESVEYVESSAFSDCRSLLEICNKSSVNLSLSESFVKHYIKDESESYLRYKEDYVFYDDGTIVYLVKYLGDETELTLPQYDGGKEYEIHFNAFFGNTKIKSVVIPNGVKRILGSAWTAGAFSLCFYLTDITIPVSVTNIDVSALLWCTSLTNINFQGTVEQWNVIAKGEHWDTNTGNYTIYCTDGEIAKDGTVTYN